MLCAIVLLLQDEASPNKFGRFFLLTARHNGFIENRIHSAATIIISKNSQASMTQPLHGLNHMRLYVFELQTDSGLLHTLAFPSLW